jgi:RimJ/RimL family protein N-acetyltransferase
MANEIWPLFDVEVRTPRLTLRYLDDALAAELVSVAVRGIHDPATTPFAVSWTDLPSPEMERNALRFYWGTRSAVEPASWTLQFAVLVDGEVAGATDLRATDFPVLREVGTGSWLGLTHQGRGLGKELRTAALALGFDGLDAHWATTGAWHDNAASRGVTESLGYERNGVTRALRRGEPDEQVLYRMSRAHWSTIRRDDIELAGIEPAREFLGLTPRPRG